MTPEPVPGSRRGRPGRPRRGDHGLIGHSLGHKTGSQDTKRLDYSGEKEAGPAVMTTVAPVFARLLDLDSTALYLGISPWKVRELDQQGILQRVRIPLADHGEVRKLLFDRNDLDKLIEAWKEGGQR